MRILIVAEADPAIPTSGAERVLAGHVEALLGRGHWLTVISGGAGPSTSAERLTVLRVGWSILTPWRVERAALALHRRAPVDALMTHHAWPAWRLVRSRRLAAIPLAYVFLSPWDEEYGVRRPAGRGPRVAFGRALRSRVEASVIRRADAVLPMSRFMAERAAATHGLAAAAIRVVPGGVNRARFAPVADRRALRAGLGLPAEVPLLLSLRNLEPRMGLEPLIRAVPAVLATRPEVQLVVAGTGPLRAALERLAADVGVSANVRFLGFVPEAALPALYATADLFVLPSQALEGFGLVTLEALACGTPVLGSRVGATPELLAPLDPGLLLADVTPGAIADAIGRILARPDRRALAARCRAHTERYGWDAIGVELERVLEGLVTARGAAIPGVRCS